MKKKTSIKNVIFVSFFGGGSEIIDVKGTLFLLFVICSKASFPECMEKHYCIYGKALLHIFEGNINARCHVSPSVFHASFFFYFQILQGIPLNKNLQSSNRKRMHF